MKLTNIHNLPDSIVSAITNDPYEGPKQRLDKLSVSTIINPPKIHFLKIRHWDDITEDVSAHLWRLLGHAVHAVLERVRDSKTIKEERLEEMVDGTIISGQMDLMGEDSIQDYKITSVWSYIYSPKGKPEWIAQLNIYRWLARNIFKINKLACHLILKDQSAAKAKSDSTYPQIPFQTINIEVWPLEKTEEYIKNRVALFKACEGLSDDKLPLCTDSEMWVKVGTWAVMKPGRKTAVKVCNTEQEAKDNCAGGCSIVYRPGSRNRCEDYCLVNKYCSQYMEYKGINNGHI